MLARLVCLCIIQAQFEPVTVNEDAVACVFDLAHKKVHGRHAQKPSHKLVHGPFKQFFWRALLLNIAAMHHDDPIRQSHRFDLVMRDVNHVLFHALAHQGELGTHLAA